MGTKRLTPQIKAEMKRDYIFNGMDQRAIAQKYGVALTTVNGYSTKENWVQERDEFYSKVQEQVVEKVQEELVDQAVDVDKEYLESYNLLHMYTKLEMSRPNPDSKKLDSYEKASRILSRLHQGSRVALGLDKDGASDDSQIKDLIAALSDSEDDE